MRSCAQEAGQMHYAPYSGFMVTASVLTLSGRVYGGSNIENAALNPSIHAEQAAVVMAMANSEHAQNHRFIKAVYVNSPIGAYPCGHCRQFLIEFADPECIVIAEDLEKNLQELSIAELLPGAFAAGGEQSLGARAQKL